jgi:Mrp family chromosome partitioning ATPase
MFESSGVRARRVIAVGGGRGGVGKTLLTVNLGVYFAQLGREVVVCDTDPFGSNLHGVLGLETPPLVTSEALEEGKAKPVLGRGYKPWRRSSYHVCLGRRSQSVGFRDDTSHAF